MGMSQHASPAERQKARLKLEAEQRRKRRELERQERAEIDESERRYVLRHPVPEDPYPREPGRDRRAPDEELGGLSEYQVTSAVAGSNQQDPIAELRELTLPHPVEEGDLTPPTMTVASRKSGPPRDTESVLPEELGAKYLRDAVQEPRPGEPDEEPPMDEELGATDSEQRLLETVSRSFAHQAGLVSDLPLESDMGKALSELSREAIHQARKAGARTHTQIRKQAGDYLARSAERLTRTRIREQRKARPSEDE